MKIAVFFPGIGYHCDKPLLYYSGKIAGQYQYELCRLSYAGLSKSTKDLNKIATEAFEPALAQTEAALKEIDWSKYEDILFVSKSIGTVVACAYAKRHGVKCRNIYYTPLEQTFSFDPQDGIVFHGTSDPWAQTKVIQSECMEHHLPLYVIEDVNHSLEATDNIRDNLRILTRVMELTESYTAFGISYRLLGEDELDRHLFDGFIRRQNVTMCRRYEKGRWIVKEDPFVDDWTEADYQVLITCLQNTIRANGFVYAAFCCGILKGFVSVEAGLFGGANNYLDLSSIHVSEDMRGRGIGRTLFDAAAEWAKGQGAGKLYISSHSAVETQAFYHAMGCVEAQEYNKEHVEKEPFDCQLEYLL